MGKLFIIISVLFNIVFGVGVIYTVHSKGGWSYLKLKLNLAPPAPDTSNPDNYEQMVSIFKIMPIKKNGIVFLGDSIMANINWAELFEDIRIKNRSIGGGWIKGALSRLDDILQLKPDKIFILLGGNDLYKKHSMNTDLDIERITSNYENILNRISESSPDTLIYILSVTPVNQEWDYVTLTNEEIRAFNESLHELADKRGIKYIDLYSKLAAKNNQLDLEYTYDGLHLNGKGYLVFKDAIESYVR